MELLRQICLIYVRTFIPERYYRTSVSGENEKSGGKMSQHIYPNSTPVMSLDCNKAFSFLTEKEKLYSHYLSKASQYGGLIVLVQTSPESPLIYCLLHRVLRAQSVADLKKVALSECGFSAEDFTAFLIYASAFFVNMGNYKGSGDSKFIPNLPKKKFMQLIRASKAASLEPKVIESLLDRCGEKIFSLYEGEKQLGFHDVGVTTYFSINFTRTDSDIVKDFMKKKNLEACNSRVFKTRDETGNSIYEIKLASVAKTEDSDVCEMIGPHTLNGHKFIVTRGDYRELLDIVNKNLLLAKEHAAKRNQAKMIENYVLSFQTGCIDFHKDGSRFYMKDVRPVIETYIGFLESNRDPSGIRGEFKGFVAMVNKLMRKTLAVSEAENFVAMLPWPSAYENDHFVLTHLTSVDALTFAGSAVCSGFDIPKYDKIRKNEGVKYVILRNAFDTAYVSVVHNYLRKADQDILQKRQVNAYEVQAGLHEFLGHRSGKLFRKFANGKFNFDVERVTDLETGRKVISWYEEGDTYYSIFSSISSLLDECKAECVGLYLSTAPEVLKTFGYKGKDADDVMYANWLNLAHMGLESLDVYEPKTKMWLQALPQARYAILQVLLEAGQGFVTIKPVKGEDGNPDLLFTMDRNKIMSVGKPAIGKFLQKIQLYKSTANVHRAKAMYDKYSAVTSEDMYRFLIYREIVLARKKPTRIIVQSNTQIEDGKVILKTYDCSAEGIVQSWAERFDNSEEVEKILEELWRRDKPYFT